MLSKRCGLCGGSGENLVATGKESPKEIWMRCEACNGEGYIPEDENLMVFVNIYEVTRHCGSSAEGGDWYNQLHCLEAIPVRNKNSDTMKEEMLKEYAHIKDGNIYSVRGGTDLAVYIERKPKESERTEYGGYE